MKKYTLSRQFSNLFAFKNSHHLDKHPLAAEITTESHRSRKFTISILLHSQTIRRLIIPLLQISLCTFGSLVAVGKISLAQVTSDGTVNTQVNQNGNVAEITGGETRGSNLFHSFQDFSVTTGNEAFFNNANDISNILSRVTGGNISNIDGLIRANGTANLFLVNPAGIIFGNNASLDIGGSFYGSTASRILFEEGEFSAADLENPPLLTVNAPIGLSFRDEPGDIVNSSLAENSSGDIVGLEVDQGNTLALIGGDISFEAGQVTGSGGNIAGQVTASGGNIELGGLSQAGTVGINQDGSLSFPGDITKANINLSNVAIVDAIGTDEGNITINARNLNLSEGEFGSSLIRAGILAESTSDEAQAGDVTINVTENIVLDNSFILNPVDEGAVGNSGNVTITTDNLTLTAGGQVNVSTSGQGDAGLVDINAEGNITVDGEGSGIFSAVVPGAVGNAGGLTIEDLTENIPEDPPLALDILTENLTISNGGQLNVSTFGQGDGGAVVVTAIESITIDGDGSSILSIVGPGAEGNGLGVLIDSTNLTLSNGGVVDASTLGQGNAGFVEINAEGDISFDNGAIFSLAAENGEGDGGDVEINAEGDISFDDGGIATLTANGEGDGGDVEINAEGDIFFKNESSILTQSVIGSSDGGNLNINARFIVAFPSDGTGNDLIATAVGGSGGDINLDVEQVFGLQAGDAIDSQNLATTLELLESSVMVNGTNDIDASSSVNGLDGAITINTADINPVQGATELPSNTVELGQTTAQTCKANREVAATNSLTIEGKGGVAPSPDLPLNSENISIDGENSDSVSTIPQAVETSQGKIQPARGVKITKSGKVILTAYRTDNSGERLPEIKRNCKVLK